MVMDVAEPNFRCFKCDVVVDGGLAGFQYHLRRIDHVPPFVCGQDDCRSDYLDRRSLYFHLRTHHARGASTLTPAAASTGTQQYGAGYPGCESTDMNIGDDCFEGEFGSVEQEDEHADNDNDLPSGQDTDCQQQQQQPPVDLRRSAELAVLRMRGINYMTGTAIESVEASAFSLMQDTAKYLQWKVQDFLSKPNRTEEEETQLLEEFVLANPFKHIKTKPHQLTCFKNKFGLLEPKEINLGPRFDSRLHPNLPQLEPTQVKSSFQYVSIKDILKSIMSDDYLRGLILNEKESEPGYIRSFRDGSVFKTLPPDLQSAVRIVLYIDDLELVQALSAIAGVYKMAGIYFGIQNLPPELNALLIYIFVTTLAFADDAKKAQVWDPFLKDMKEVEEEGVTILVDGEPFTIKAVLVAHIGDTLAAHEVLGFLAPSAHRFCRRCYIVRPEMWEDGTKVGEPRSPEQHDADVQASVRSAARQTATGVAGPSKLLGLRFFQTTSHSVFDVFHDLLQGVCKMEVKLALREYVCIKKYFSIGQLNSRIQFFDYGFTDIKNKPVAKMTEKYLNDISSYNLQQSGAQMWCLVRVFGFLVADLVPADDKFLQLVSLLNQIMSHVFSYAFTEDDLNNLEDLIIMHHNLFKEIFPGRQEQTAPVEENASVSAEEVGEDDIAAAEEFDEIFDTSDDDLEAAGEETEPPQQAAQESQPKRRKKAPRIVRMINKHHHMLHYVELIRLFGPLILYWCMRYEARHFIFKLAATVSHNYKNILKTLMEMIQMKTAAERHNPRDQLIMGKRGTKLMFVSDCCHAAALLSAGVDALSKVYQVDHVTFKGVDYRPKLFCTLKLQTPSTYPVFAQITAVYVSGKKDQVYLLVREWKTVKYEPLIHAFHVAPLADSSLIAKSPADFPSFRLLSKWKRYDSESVYLAPRTIA